ncbi:hypothetical protein BGZ65_008239, partial [Modicella reniformis]
MSTNFTVDQTAPFAELAVRFQVVSAKNQTVVCVAILIEQNMTRVNTAVSYLPLALALYSAMVSFVSIIVRAAIGNGFMSALATYGLATTSGIVSVHTPGIFDIFSYTQFIVMTGQLSINYPSFYSTFTSLFHWSFLEFPNSFAGSGPENATEVLKYGGAGSVNLIKGSKYPVDNRKLGNQLMSMSWDQEFSTTLRSSIGTIPAIDIMAPTSSPTVSSENRHQKRQQLEPTQATEPPPTTTTLSTSTNSTNSTSTTTKSTTKSSSNSTTSSSTKSKSTTTTLNSQTVTFTKSSIPTSTVIITPTITDPFNSVDSTYRKYNVSRYGMEAYAAAIGMFPSDIFLCTLINIIVAGGVSLFLSTFVLVVIWSSAKSNHRKNQTLQYASNFVAGNLLRVWSLFYTPLALSAMYQLTISGSTLLMAIASVSLLILSVGVTVLLTWRILHASARLLLFENMGALLKYGPLYNTLTEEGTLFFLVNLLVRFLWGLCVAMLSTHAIAQIGVLLAVELGYMLVIGVKWPFTESGDNKFHLLLGFLRIVITGCSIAYLHELDTTPEVRQLFGYIQMALHLAVFIVMFALILWNTIQVVLLWQSRHRTFWKTKVFGLEGTAEHDHDWVVTGRPQSRRPAPALVNPNPMQPVQTRRYTVQPYSSITNIQSADDEDLTRHRSAFRHTLQASGYRQSRFPLE